MTKFTTTRLVLILAFVYAPVLYSAAVNAADNPVTINTGIPTGKPIEVIVEKTVDKPVEKVKNSVKKVAKKVNASNNTRYKGGYQVNSGDILNIMVWKENELQGDVIVRPDGGISFPLVGDLQVEGKSIKEVQNDISRNLKHYIPDPVVTVSVKKLSGHKLYVIGRVQRPGVFFIEQQTDVLQVLAMAGGLTSYASSDDIKIIRREGKIQKVFHFDYSKVESGEGLDKNRILKSGDVVVVP